MINCKVTKNIYSPAFAKTSKHLLVITSLLISSCLASQAFAAEKAEKKAASVSESSSSRIKELTYDEATVYVIRTKYGYQTNIAFDPKEEIQTMSVGDRSMWQIVPAGSRLFIRPMADNLSTNMTLLTNKRSYEFDLKSVDEKNESNNYVIRFVYPEKIPPVPAGLMADPFAQPSASHQIVSIKPETEANVLKLPASSKPKKSPESSANNNYNYTYSGLDSLAPLQVYDDGHSTYIKYQTMPKSIPSALVIAEDGSESPAPSMVNGSSLIIDGIAGEIALRNANGEIRIYNESVNPR